MVVGTKLTLRKGIVILCYKYLSSSQSCRNLCKFLLLQISPKHLTQTQSHLPLLLYVMYLYTQPNIQIMKKQFSKKIQSRNIFYGTLYNIQKHCILRKLTFWPTKSQGDTHHHHILNWNKCLRTNEIHKDGKIVLYP